jgi:hypothetical protein
MTLPKAVRQHVRNRAGNCCEYCRLSAAAGAIPFHVDHINPVKHGGTDDTDNLCLACYKCNAHKGHDLVGFDPQTGELARLYHPREQRWEEHFTIQADMRIQGLTSQRRTTVRVLQMNDEDRLENRQLLAEIGEYPCL